MWRNCTGVMLCSLLMEGTFSAVHVNECLLDPVPAQGRIQKHNHEKECWPEIYCRCDAFCFVCRRSQTEN